MKRFNSKFGCHRCYVETKSIGLRCIYPLLKSNQIEKRTISESEEIRKKQLEGAVELPHKGINGSTSLGDLDFDYISRTPCEYMHVVLLGFVRLWINEIIIDGVLKELSSQDCRKINISEFDKLLQEIHQFSRGTEVLAN